MKYSRSAVRSDVPAPNFCQCPKPRLAGPGDPGPGDPRTPPGAGGDLACLVAGVCLAELIDRWKIALSNFIRIHFTCSSTCQLLAIPRQSKAVYISCYHSEKKKEDNPIFEHSEGKSIMS